ncbi:protein kinase, partial [bacterium]|nr:protein kinase [candidate division CSSED10-310 bacterium]
MYLTHLDRYDQLQEVFSSEFTRVLKARDGVTGNPVAIKMLISNPPESLRRNMIQAYRVMATCHHPLLVPVIHFGTAGDACYYVMPWIQHQPARSRVWRVHELVQLAMQVCQSLIYLHRAEHSFDRLDPDCILWMTEPDANEYHVRLINYGRDSTGTDRIQPVSERAAVDFQGDLQRLADVIDCLGSACSAGEVVDGTQRMEQRGLRRLKDALHEAVHESLGSRTDSAWNLMLRLMQIFENHPYEKRPARQIVFTEAPFVGRRDAMSSLSEWKQQSSAGSILLFVSLPHMGRYRVLRHWLAEQRIAGETIIELTRESIDAMADWFGGRPSFPDNSEASRWLDSLRTPLAVLHRESIDALDPGQWQLVIAGVRARGWKLLVSLNDHHSREIDTLNVPGSLGVQILWLSPISYSDTCQTLSMLLDSQRLSRRLQMEVHKLARGNPGLIIIAVNFWIAEDLLIKEHDQWELQPDQNTPLPIPPAIQHHFRKRLESLSPDMITLLKTMALIDSPMDSGRLECFAGKPDIRETIDMLVRRDVVTLERLDETQFGYGFSHSTIRMAILETMTETEQRERHAQIAEIMERNGWSEDRTAWHWLMSGFRERGVVTGLAAAWQLRHKGNFNAAEKWVDRLRMVLTDLPPEMVGEVYYLHAEISLLKHRHQDVIESGLRALESFPRRIEYAEKRSFLYQYMAQVYFREGRNDAAMASVVAGLAEVPEGNVETAVTLRVLQGVVARAMGRYGDVDSILNQCRKDVVSIDDETSRASAWATMLNLESTVQLDRGDMVAARTVLEEAVRISDAHHFNYYRAL